MAYAHEPRYAAALANAVHQRQHHVDQIMPCGGLSELIAEGWTEADYHLARIGALYRIAFRDEPGDGGRIEAALAFEHRCAGLLVAHVAHCLPAGVRHAVAAPGPR